MLSTNFLLVEISFKILSIASKAINLNVRLFLDKNSLQEVSPFVENGKNITEGTFVELKNLGGFGFDLML